MTKKAPKYRLTPRQAQVAPMLADGLTNGEIAHRLGINLESVKGLVGRIMRETQAQNRTQAAVRLARGGYEIEDGRAA